MLGPECVAGGGEVEQEQGHQRGERTGANKFSTRNLRTNPRTITLIVTYAVKPSF
jgi:hypothetical protein